MEPESKVAPEAISEIRPMSYEQLATMFYATQAELLAARERIASLTAQVATLESEKAAAHEAIDEVVRGLEVIHTATPDGHDGFFHDLRAFLDERDIFNDDLYGERVISAAVKYLLDRVRSLSAPTKKQPK